MAGDRSVHGEPAFAGLPASNDEFVRQVLGRDVRKLAAGCHAAVRQ
jgi:hypothetical protein